MSNLLNDSEANSDDFAAAAGAASGFDPVTFQGYLQKKSPRGFLGKHIWQRRFFVLEKGGLQYYKDKSKWASAEEPIGIIRIDMIRDIQVPSDSSHSGLRFDILAVGGHLFELMSPSEKSCTQWVRALREEMATRRGSVSDMIRHVKDEQVADGYWKTGGKDKEKGKEKLQELHAHAEKAVPVSKKSSRSNSRGGFGTEADDEEARERAQALAAMMAEEEGTESPDSKSTMMMPTTRAEARRKRMKKRHTRPLRQRGQVSTQERTRPTHSTTPPAITPTAAPRTMAAAMELPRTATPSPMHPPPRSSVLCPTPRALPLCGTVPRVERESLSCAAIQSTSVWFCLSRWDTSQSLGSAIGR